VQSRVGQASIADGLHWMISLVGHASINDGLQWMICVCGAAAAACGSQTKQCVAWSRLERTAADVPRAKCLLLPAALRLAGNALAGDALTSERRGAIEAAMNRTLRSAVRDWTELRNLTELRNRTESRNGTELRDRTELTSQRRTRRT